MTNQFYIAERRGAYGVQCTQTVATGPVRGPIEIKATEDGAFSSGECKVIFHNCDLRLFTSARLKVHIWPLIPGMENEV